MAKKTAKKAKKAKKAEASGKKAPKAKPKTRAKKAKKASSRAKTSKKARKSTAASTSKKPKKATKAAAKSARAAAKSSAPKSSKGATQAKKVKKKKSTAKRLSKSALEPYKQALLERKAKLVRQVLVQDDDMEELRDDQPADPLDMAMNTSSLELMTALGNNERLELGEIEDALAKIEDGTYGICESCIEEPLNLCPACPNILQARLEAIPTARYCVQVKAQQERTPGVGFSTERPRRRALIGDDITVSSDDE